MGLSGPEETSWERRSICTHGVCEDKSPTSRRIRRVLLPQNHQHGINCTESPVFCCICGRNQSVSRFVSCCTVKLTALSAYPSMRFCTLRFNDLRPLDVEEGLPAWRSGIIRRRFLQCDSLSLYLRSASLAGGVAGSSVLLRYRLGSKCNFRLVVVFRQPPPPRHSVPTSDGISSLEERRLVMEIRTPIREEEVGKRCC